MIEFFKEFLWVDILDPSEVITPVLSNDFIFVYVFPNSFSYKNIAMCSFINFGWEHLPFVIVKSIFF